MILLQSENIVLHVEFQTQPDLSIPFRMLDYWVRAYRRFPERTMRQVVIYLRESSSPLVLQTCFERSQTRHQFQVIRLWEQPVQTFMNVPGLLPFAVLGQTDDRPRLLQQVAEQIESIADRRTQNNLTASTAILAGLVLDKALIQRVLRQTAMRESVIYQDIIKEGLEQGRKQGLEQGLEQGLKQGRRDGERSLVFKLLNRRVGELPLSIQTDINQMSLEALEALGEALLDFATLDDLVKWLRTYQQQRESSSMP